MPLIKIGFEPQHTHTHIYALNAAALERTVSHEILYVLISESKINSHRDCVDFNLYWKKEKKTHMYRRADRFASWKTEVKRKKFDWKYRKVFCTRDKILFCTSAETIFCGSAQTFSEEEGYRTAHTYVCVGDSPSNGLVCDVFFPTSHSPREGRTHNGWRCQNGGFVVFRLACVAERTSFATFPHHNQYSRWHVWQGAHNNVARAMFSRCCCCPLSRTQVTVDTSDFESSRPPLLDVCESFAEMETDKNTKKSSFGCCLSH